MGKIWNEIPQEIENEFWRLKTGQPEANPANYEFVHREYFHARDYAAAQRIDFFNEAEQSFVTNLNNGMVPNNEPFWLTDLAIIVTDRKRSGAAATARAVSSIDATTNANTLLLHDMLAAGQFRLVIGSQQKLLMRNLHRLGAGGGISISGAGTFAAGTTVLSSANGAPATRNTFKLPRPLAILPNQKISVALEWGTSITVGSWDGCVIPLLIGEAVAARAKS